MESLIRDYSSRTEVVLLLLIIIIIIIVFILRDGGVTQMSLNKCRQVVVLGGLALTVIIIILIGTLIIREQVLPK